MRPKATPGDPSHPESLPGGDLRSLVGMPPPRHRTTHHASVRSCCKMMSERHPHPPSQYHLPGRGQPHPLWSKGSTRGMELNPSPFSLLNQPPPFSPGFTPPEKTCPHNIPPGSCHPRCQGGLGSGQGSCPSEVVLCICLRPYPPFHQTFPRSFPPLQSPQHHRTKGRGGG